PADTGKCSTQADSLEQLLRAVWMQVADVFFREVTFHLYGNSSLSPAPALLAVQLLSAGSQIREAFKVLDHDGNGFISKQELGMAMRSLGYMPSEVELAIIMQRLDMDGDGQVDFEEFMTILGPKLLSSETRDGFLGSTIDSIFWQRQKGLRCDERRL
ncbi:hypothetical protein KUCAC02_005654, partial [Chaenocephalus aceratus]